MSRADISASAEGRTVSRELANKVGHQIFLCVAGGIRTIQDAEKFY